MKTGSRTLEECCQKSCSYLGCHSSLLWFCPSSVDRPTLTTLVQVLPQQMLGCSFRMTNYWKMDLVVVFVVVVVFKSLLWIFEMFLARSIELCRNRWIKSKCFWINSKIDERFFYIPFFLSVSAGQMRLKWSLNIYLLIYSQHTLDTPYMFRHWLNASSSMAHYD